MRSSHTFCTTLHSSLQLGGIYSNILNMFKFPKFLLNSQKIMELVVKLSRFPSKYNLVKTQIDSISNISNKSFFFAFIWNELHISGSFGSK